MFKGQRFELRTVEEVKEDIRAARSLADAVRASAERYGQREIMAMDSWVTDQMNGTGQPQCRS